MPSKLWEVMYSLIDTALGRVKADLVIKNANLINVYSGEIIENSYVAIKGDRIAYVGYKGEHTIGDSTIVLDLEGREYLAPGFLDAHVHIESSMLTLTEFAKIVIPRGTTGVFIDPHEICNVLGEYGFRLIAEEAKRIPLKVFLQVPSCVPAASLKFESPGAIMDSNTVRKLLKRDDVIALGEMMNYPGVLNKDSEVMNKIAYSLLLGKIVTGHAPGLYDKELSAYIASGISSCHESTRSDEALEKLRLGMYVIIREGSAWRDVKEVVKIVTTHKTDIDHILLATDDRHSEDILEEGHIDFVIRRVIEEGVDPIRAIKMATLNTARYYGLESELGGISPGKIADLVILKDLSRVNVSKVILDGKLIAKEGKLLAKIERFKYPKEVKQTIKLKRDITPKDLEIICNKKKGKVRAHVIRVIEEKTITIHEVEELNVENYKVQPDLEKDIIFAAVIERHKGTGRVGKGFVRGLGLKKGAFASSVAHDSHNIIVIGANTTDMTYAVNELKRIGGGMIVVVNGNIKGKVELPIAGLMSDKPAEEVAEEVIRLRRSLESLGCRIKSPFMTISLLALTVIPEIRLSDKGLIDVKKMKIISPIEV